MLEFTPREAVAGDQWTARAVRESRSQAARARPWREQHRSTRTDREALPDRRWLPALGWRKYRGVALLPSRKQAIGTRGPEPPLRPARVGRQVPCEFPIRASSC